jgi:hypothetical protein
MVRDIQEPEPEPEPAPSRGRDLEPDEVVMPKADGGEKKPKPNRPRNRKHGRAR